MEKMVQPTKNIVTEIVLTDNSEERQSAKWDEERFYLIEYRKHPVALKVTVQNPREALDYATFIMTFEKDIKRLLGDK